MTRSFSLFCLLLALCLTVTAVHAADDAARQAAVQKSNSYVELYNTLGSDPARDYTSNFGDSASFKADTPKWSMQAHYMDDKIKAMDNALSFADKEPAMKEADAAVKALGPVLRSLMEKMKEAADYYTNKRYIDDDYARGKELHKEIVPELAALPPLLKNFQAAVLAMEAQRKREQVQTLREEGAVTRAAMVEVINASQDLCAELARQGINSRNLLDLDLAAYRPVYKALAGAVDSLEKTVQDEQQMRKEGLPGVQIMQAYLKDAQAIRINAAGILERVQKREAVSKAEMMNAANSKNTPEAVQRLANRLIDRHNKL